MLKLVPPGKRKGNAFYLVRGRFLGTDYEISTQTTDKVAAERFKNRFERRILEGHIPGSGEAVTFAKAADLYISARDLSKADLRRIERLKAQLGKRDVRDVLQADLDAAAKALYPKCSPESLNRNVYTPAGAVLHYAAENKWCPWLRVKRPKMKEPETRAAREGVDALLCANTEGKERLLIAWLFKHGTRVSNALRVDCGRVDLRARTYELYISKTRKWQTFGIDGEVWDLLANDRDATAGKGMLFPWTNRWQVYRWLRPLCKRLGVKFTPHMARHRLGKDMNAEGAGLKTIMRALGQSSEKSASRYASADIDAVRDVMERLGKKLGTGKASG